MSKKELFCINDFNCIGFDLDNTLLEYCVEPMSELVYNILAKFLIEQKGYKPKFLLQPFQDGVKLLQRGLALDFQLGNILKLDTNGVVLIGYHGSHGLAEEELIRAYGPTLKWNLAQTYIEDILKAWNGLLSTQMRFVLDYFDVSSVLVFARVIDTIDDRNGIKDYSVAWHDILAGLNYMYNKENFQSNQGEFFSALKEEPRKFIKECSLSTIQWLKQLREKEKIIFLITGSAFDFASFTATMAMGSSWLDLFDVVVTFARKPNFFIGDRRFLDKAEANEIDIYPLPKDKIISHGSWKEFKIFLEKKLHGAEARVVYCGDNAVQDILAPVSHGCCQTLAICQEMEASDDSIVGVSPIWGSYLHACDGSPTFWNSVLQKYSIKCFPSIKALVDIPLETKLEPYNLQPKDSKVRF